MEVNQCCTNGEGESRWKTQCMVWKGEMTVVVHGYMGHVRDDVEELLRLATMGVS